MIDTLLNLLFRCAHRRLTRPVSPVTKAGEPHSPSYVVCLDCGKQFEYDLREMRMGKVIKKPEEGNKSKVKFALAAAVPAAMVLGAVMKKKAPPRERGT